MLTVLIKLVYMMDDFEKRTIPSGMPMLPVMPVTLDIETIDISFGLVKSLFAILLETISAISVIKIYKKGTFKILISIFCVNN